MSSNYDAVITGSGPNGIAAAIYLQEKGLKTAVYEQSAIPGGSAKTEALTLQGFKHDVGAAIMPMAFASPFFRNLPLDKFGLDWIFPEIPYAHPFADGRGYACYPSIEKTALQLGQDAEAYQNLMRPIVENWPKLEHTLLGPLGWPAHPLEFIKFGLKALPSAKTLSDLFFKDDSSKVFFYGAAAHSTLPLNNLASSSFGLVLAAMAHKYGWPFPKGGATNFIKSLLNYYRSLGGELYVNAQIGHLEDLPKANAYLFDLTPKQLLKIKGFKFTNLYRNRMSNFKYGAGIFKVDWALSEPIPFKNEKCRKAGTVHLGFTKKEMENSEKYADEKKISDTPYVLVAQHSLFDDTRAPRGKHTGWAYCHVPNGSIADFSEIIENQVERAAPGFKDTILARSVKNTEQMHHFNPNIIGGDINGGRQDITQLFTRPVAKISPYSTPDERIYICSSSTPPGGGVHGMCGVNAAKKVLKDHFAELK